jgi:hypothetical protein
MADPTLRRSAVRPADLLVVELAFYGVDAPSSSQPDELKRSGTADVIVVVALQPQHIAEESVPQKQALDSGDDQSAYLPRRMAGWSRVAFRVPAEVATVPLRLEPLLDLLGTCELSVVATALPQGEPKPVLGCLGSGLLQLLFAPKGPPLEEPAQWQTALELPFRLILSPTQTAGFAHRSRPVTSPPPPDPSLPVRTELWHAHLGLQPGLPGTPEDAPKRTVRAVWMRQGHGAPWSPSDPMSGPPESPPAAPEPFPTSLTQRDRHTIVHLSANFRWADVKGFRSFKPGAIEVRRLVASSLGSWFDARADWGAKSPFALEEWTHRSAMGRDYYVRKVYGGWLFPFGHRATLVEIHERKFDSTRPGRPAVIRVRFFVVVRQPVRTYRPAEAPTPPLSRTMPLRVLEARTLVTPDIDPPTNKLRFPIRVSGQYFAFLFHGSDAESGGNPVSLLAPVWFVSKDATPDDVKFVAMGAGGYGTKVTGTGGVPLDHVPLDDKGPGESTWPTHSLTWAGEPVPRPKGDPVAPFHPRVVESAVHLPAVQLVSGATSAATIRYHDRYVAHGFAAGQNAGKVVAGIAGALPMGFSGKADRSGGLIKPDMSISGLSRTLGAVGGSKLADVASGAFNPSDYFAGAAGRLFGVIELPWILKAVALFEGGSPKAPELLVDRAGDQVTGVLRWKPKLQNYPTDPAKSIFDTRGGTAGLEVEVRTQAGLSGPGSASIRATLSNFTIRLIPDQFECVRIRFAKAEFKADAAGKPDVDVRLEGVDFVGPLSFVEVLRTLIDLDGFSDPPALDISPAGVEASFSLSLPTLAMGMFSLEDISLGAGFLVPFDNRALAVRFNFCERHQPFHLTVSAIGGGGFFGIELDPQGIQRLEAAFEFGASLSMDFGVASGGVHVFAGIYFAYQSGKGATLQGYFRVGGHVSALGLVTVSIELNLSLTYEESSGKAVGRATLTIEIDVFLFSASVEVSCERKFAGSASDPRFAQVMAPYVDPDDGTTVDPWAEYCEAYA